METSVDVAVSPLRKHRPTRAAAGHRLRDPHLHHHARLLQLVLGLQDHGGDRSSTRTRGSAGCSASSSGSCLSPSWRSSSRPRSGRCTRRTAGAADDRVDGPLALPVRDPDHSGDRLVREGPGRAQPLLGVERARSPRPAYGAPGSGTASRPARSAREARPPGVIPTRGPRTTSTAVSARPELEGRAVERAGRRARP